MSLPADRSLLPLDQDREASPAWGARLHVARQRLDASLAGRLPAAFVLSAWAVLTISGILYVAHFGLTSPYADEWRWTAQVVGAAPVDLAWLCQAQNGHRIPLFKLVYLTVLRAGGYDFRGGAVLSVLLLATASLAALLVARRLRGHWEWTDVVLPAVLLNWSQALNLVWGFQLFYVLPTALVLGFLLIVCVCRPRLPLGAGLGLALIVWCLPGCGGPGICCLPPLALWLALAAADRCTAGQSSRHTPCAVDGARSVPTTMTDPTWQRAVGGLVCAAALFSLVSLPWYFSGALGAGSWEPSTPPLDLRRAAVSAVQVLSMSMGRLAEDLWPVSGAAVVACSAFVGLRLTSIAWRDRPERIRALGLAAVLVALGMLAVGIGATRWHFGYGYCFARRYTTLSAPLLVALYLAAVRYGRLPSRPSTQFALAMTVLVVLVTYQRNGWNQAADLATLVHRLERNALDGLPPAALAVRCSADAQCRVARLTTCLELLRDAEIGPYRHASTAPVDSVDGDAAQDTSSTLVLPIGPCRQPTPAGHAPLDSGVWHHQPIPEGERLFGIDLRLRRQRRDPAPPTLDWRVVAVDSAGQRAELCSGTIEPRSEPDPIFARLRFSPLTPPPGARLELGLRSASSRPARLPLFVSADTAAPSPQGFAFFRPAPQTSP